ncbi:MAG: penicillin-binding protein [Clostridia bacterium]|nr:penicillin-binding protein [Clostridia bacterium]
MRKNKLLRFSALAVAIPTAIVALAIVGIHIFAKININYEADEVLFERSRSWDPTVFYADANRSARDIQSSYTPVEIARAGSVRKAYYSINEISSYVKDGFVAVEDREFYNHSGVNYKRTLAAALNYITRRERIFGASTITQQVIKNISGDNELSLSRKLSEILRSLHIERMYSKDEIMEVYLNVIPMSENVFGIGMASRIYFGKEPSALTVPEAATLIGITNAPSAYNPYNNPASCLKKRNSVLSVMRSEGVITDTEYAAAVAAPLEVIPREEQEDRYDSWFIETAIDDISADLAEKLSLSDTAARMMLLGGGYSVYTTMDINVQKTLEEYFSDETNFPKEINKGLNYSMVVTDSKSGELLGLVGRVGEKRANRLLNHATVPHTPASALKPIALYAPLLDEGEITWSTVFDDVPTDFVGEALREYPRNSPSVYSGLITVKDAIRHSKNTVAVKLSGIIGTRRIFDSLRNDFAFDTLVESRKGQGGTLTDVGVSAMALGQLTDGVSLRRLTEAYSVFVGDGIRRSAVTYTKVLDSVGNIILDNPREEQRIFSESTARIMNQLLKNVTEDGTAAMLTLKQKLDTAGKTGTSSGARDKIFVGYTPYYTAGIWCGYDNGTDGIGALSVSHLTVWDDIMTDIHRDILTAEKQIEHFSTEGLLYRPYCKDSGKLYSNNCRFDPRGDRREYGYFAAGTEPAAPCETHVLCYYDSVSKGIADISCPEEYRVKVSLIRTPKRSFPKELNITDAEYVYRDIDAYEDRPDDTSLPYFYFTLPEGEYAGVSGKKKQFNRAGKTYE